MITDGDNRSPQRRHDPWEGKRKLLAVADVQTGYHHDVLSQTLATLQRLGKDSEEFVTNIRTDSQLITRQPIIGQGAKYGGKRVNARGLDQYDALFLLPSGEGTLSSQEKQDLIDFVYQDGKGLIVGHAGLLGFYDWPDFALMVGGGFGGEFMGTATVQIDDPDFPGAAAFGQQDFEFTEQHLVVKEPYCRDDVNVIFSLRAESVDPRHREKRPNGDFPVIWSKTFGRGRILNVGWGHLDATWDDPRFQQFMLEGIMWAMGQVERNVEEKK